MCHNQAGRKHPIIFDPGNGNFYDLLEPAMRITEQDEADKYFAALVDWYIKHGHFHFEHREETVKYLRRQLAYFAGYYTNEVRYRVEGLFSCAHPVFGSIAKNGPPTPREAFKMGKKIAENMGKRSRE